MMASSTSFRNKIADLEARLNAEIERKRPDPLPTGFMLESPRRPKPFVNTCMHPTQLVVSTAPHVSPPASPVNLPPRTLTLATPTRNMTLGMPPVAMVVGTSPGPPLPPRNMTLGMPPGGMVPGTSSGPPRNMTLVTPPGGIGLGTSPGPSRNMTLGTPPGGMVLGTPPGPPRNMTLNTPPGGMVLGTPPGPPRNMTLNTPPGGMVLGTPSGPSRNMTLNTPPGEMVPGTPTGSTNAGLSPGCSNVQMRRKNWQSPWECKTPDRSSGSEIERKYSEIMKQTGVLTIDGQKVKADITELDPLGELGHGTCGYVIKMRHRQTNTLMAVKQMRRSRNNEENKRIIMDLDVVMKSHNCPYIVRCIGTFITSSDVWICMELMATCLDKLLKRLKAAIPENILGKVTVATVKALHYLKEEHGVIHRDVKPSNILLNERGEIKLCDFGISGRLVDSKAKTRSAGCAAYMAPERIDPPDPSQPDYDVRADVWSLGVSLVELATGAFPYKNCNNDFEVLAKVVNDDPPVLLRGSGFSNDFCFFVNQCLIKDHKKRPKYRKLLEYSFIRCYEAVQVDVGDWYACVVEQLRWSSSSTTPPSPGGSTPTGFWSFTSA